MLSVCFAKFFRETVPLLFAVFQSSVCLRFFWNGSPGCFGRFFWAQKCPSCIPKTAKKKVLPALGLFSEFYFCYGAFSGGFWATSSVFCDGCVFVGFGCVFCVDLFISLPFSGFWGRCFRVRFFFSPLPPSSSPFLLMGSAWISFLFFFAPACRTTVGLRRQVRLCTWHPLSIALSLFFFSLSLSLFLLCLSCLQAHESNRQLGKLWKVQRDEDRYCTCFLES